MWQKNELKFYLRQLGSFSKIFSCILFCGTREGIHKYKLSYSLKVKILNIPPFAGYVYMNGDIGKLPPGAVYPATPESLGPQVAGAIGGGVPNIDYGVMNGAPSGSELILDAGVGSLEPSPQHAISMHGGAVGYSPVDVAALGDASAAPPSVPMTDLNVPGIPLEQLKQMLSSQLEYYFSR